LQRLETQKKDQERRTAYDALSNNYPFPKYTNKDRALDQLSSWEAQNPRQCSLIWDDGKTISFSSPIKEVAKINLSNFTRLIFVPAMLDASIDMTSLKGALAEIIAMAAEAVMPEPERIAGLKRETQQKSNRSPLCCTSKSSNASQLARLHRNILCS
jgi:hypothetical protein